MNAQPKLDLVGEQSNDHIMLLPVRSTPNLKKLGGIRLWLSVF